MADAWSKAAQSLPTLTSILTIYGAKCVAYGARSPRLLSRVALPFLAKQLMTLAKLSDYLDVPRTALERLLKSEEGARLPAVRVEDKWCVDLADVQEWLLKKNEEHEH
jgi:hypothetical protein